MNFRQHLPAALTLLTLCQRWLNSHAGNVLDPHSRSRTVALGNGYIRDNGDFGEVDTGNSGMQVA